MPLPPELKDLAARVSNWGRWGADDQRGTLNLITPDAVLRGIRAARQGRSFSLAIPFDETGPQWDNSHMPAPHRTRSCTRTRSTSPSPATRATSRRATTRSAWARRPPRTGTRSRTSGTRASSTTTRPTRSSPLRRRRAPRHRALRGGRDTRRAARHRPSPRRRPLRRQLRDHRRRPRAALRARRAVTVEPGDALLVRTGHMHFLRPGEKQRVLDAVARAVDAVDRLAARPRRRGASPPTR